MSLLALVTVKRHALFLVQTSGTTVVTCANRTKSATLCRHRRARSCRGSRYERPPSPYISSRLKGRSGGHGPKSTTGKSAGGCPCGAESLSSMTTTLCSPGSTVAGSRTDSRPSGVTVPCVSMVIISCSDLLVTAWCAPRLRATPAALLTPFRGRFFQPTPLLRFAAELLLILLMREQDGSAALS